MTPSDNDECLGHLNIRAAHFPFGMEDGKYIIDQEGCGIEPQEEFLIIQFCPVCGQSL